MQLWKTLERKLIFDFTPPLPVLRQQLMKRSYMGGADGPLSVTFDQCSEHGEVACLMAFVGGKLARTWSQKPEAERKQIVIEHFAKYFGEEARKPLAYAEQDWNAEEWSGGAPITIFPTGVLSVH